MNILPNIDVPPPLIEIAYKYEKFFTELANEAFREFRRVAKEGDDPIEFAKKYIKEKE